MIKCRWFICQFFSINIQSCDVCLSNYKNVECKPCLWSTCSDIGVPRKIEKWCSVTELFWKNI